MCAALWHWLNQERGCQMCWAKVEMGQVGGHSLGMRYTSRGL